MVLIMTSIIQVLGETECNGTRKLKFRFELKIYHGNIVRYVEKIADRYHIIQNDKHEFQRTCAWKARVRWQKMRVKHSEIENGGGFVERY